MMFVKDYNRAAIFRKSHPNALNARFFDARAMNPDLAMPQNDSAFYEATPVAKTPSLGKMQMSDILGELKEIVREEEQKSYHCIGRLLHDKTLAQIELRVQREQLAKTHSPSESILKGIEDKRQLINTLDECIALVRKRLKTLQTELRQLSLSSHSSSKNTGGHDALSFKKDAPNPGLVSKNSSGFWTTKTGLEKAALPPQNEIVPHMGR